VTRRVLALATLFALAAAGAGTWRARVAELAAVPLRTWPALAGASFAERAQATLLADHDAWQLALAARLPAEAVLGVQAVRDARRLAEAHDQVARGSVPPEAEALLRWHRLRNLMFPLRVVGAHELDGAAPAPRFLLTRAGEAPLPELAARCERQAGRGGFVLWRVTR
jgi:hypothetical protein